MSCQQVIFTVSPLNLGLALIAVDLNVIDLFAFVAAP